MNRQRTWKHDVIAGVLVVSALGLLGVVVYLAPPVLIVAPLLLLLVR